MKIKEILQEFLHEEEPQDPKLSKILCFMKMYIICWLLSVLIIFSYAEIGHAKGWQRAEKWHTYLHTYKFIPW